MNILHYTIGLPDKRSGGSVISAYDIMKSQSAEHTVSVLLPGDALFRTKRCSIVASGEYDGIRKYTLKSPLTAPLMCGIKNPDRYMAPRFIDADNILHFIERNKFDVLHLHTCMGMPIEVLRLFKASGVRLVYTVHDYFGLCPKVDLLHQGGTICKNCSGRDCALCNMTSKSEFFMRLWNSTIFCNLKGYIKRYKFLNNLGSRIIMPSIKAGEKRVTEDLKRRYVNLQDYYIDWLDKIDTFHFNSEQTKREFTARFAQATGRVIPLGTDSVIDRRKLRECGDEIKFGYVGSLNSFKGFPVLKAALVNLAAQGVTNWDLKVWGSGIVGKDKDCEKIKYLPNYSRSEMEKALSTVDCLIVPSKWLETFSLVTLESLSLGVPVIVSSKVGAKQLVEQIDNSFVFTDEGELLDKLSAILSDRSILSEFNKKIVENSWMESVAADSDTMMELYRSN